MAKILLSFAALVGSGDAQAVWPGVLETLQFAVPATIYFVNNNLVFFILSRLDATTFQLLSQLKVVFTGLLFRLFLGRKLAVYQYLAILQLTCGTVTSQLPAFDHGRSSGARTATLSGVALSVVSCVLSAFGGIYAEKLLKNKPRESIHLQNMQLYSWGIAINFVGVFVHSGTTVFKLGFFSGFNGWAWAVVLNNALNGLAISAILKYADNIARVYAHACAMLVTMIISVPLFGEEPNPHMVIAIVMVAISALQYNLDPKVLVSKGPDLDRPEGGTPEETKPLTISTEEAPEDEPPMGSYLSMGSGAASPPRGALCYAKQRSTSSG